MKKILNLLATTLLKSFSTKTGQLIFLVFTFTFLSNKLLFGQFVPLILREDNLEIRSRTEKVEPAGWLYFKESAHVKPGDLFSELKDYTGLTANDDMVTTKSWTDDYGWSHIRYQQVHKGLKVEGAEYSEHWKDCYLELAHGKLIENLEINEIPTLSEDQALGIALQEINAEEYAWENESWEQSIKEDLEDSSATYFPEGELIISHALGGDFVKENYRLAWRFEIFATEPPSLDEILIDAHSGEVQLREPIGEYDGPAITLYNGTQIIDTEWRGGLYQNFRLKTNDNGRNIHTKYGDGAINIFWLTSDITDEDDNWPEGQSLGTTAHWVISQAWDYFQIVHGRDGYDDSSEKIRVWADSDMENAGRFRRSGMEFIAFGAIDGNSLATLDIGAHEFTHGLTANLSDLGRFREPGALNESFSDIFGFLGERFSEGVVTDWLIGEDAVPGGIRSLQNPGVLGNPDTFLGLNWFPADEINCPDPDLFNDNCGIHINCGVQNFWFHLLSQGGFHNGVNIQPIGIDNSAEITYYSLATFIQEESQYEDARQGAISAARFIFNPCSFEEIQTTNAWSAVGVGPIFTGPCFQMAGPELICVDKFFEETFTAFDIPGSVFTWTFPPQWTANTSGPGNMYLTVSDLGYLPPYYPYVLEVSVISSNGGTISMEVALDSCFTLEPPCVEGGFHPMSINGSIQEEAKAKNGKAGTQGLGKDNDERGVKIYPNPVRNILTISFPPSLRYEKEIILIHSNGREIGRWEAFGDFFSCDTSSYPSGSYSLRIVSNDFFEARPLIKVE